MTDNSKQQGGLETVILRNEFYRDNYRTAFIALIVLALVNVLLLGGIAYKVTHPMPPQYFATTADGRMIALHPLSDPVVSDDYVLQWTSNAIRKTFTLDYVHWRQQLQDASTSFTPGGWKDFVQALKKSNNLKTLTDLKMVSSAKITGAPTITQKAIIDGTYAWKIQVPIMVTFENKARQIPMPLDVTLIVVRVPVQHDPDRIAINNFLPEPQKTAEQTLTDGM